MSSGQAELKGPGFRLGMDTYYLRPIARLTIDAVIAQTNPLKRLYLIKSLGRYADWLEGEKCVS